MLPFHALYPRSQLCFESLRSRPVCSLAPQASPGHLPSPVLCCLQRSGLSEHDVNPYIQNPSTPPITTHNLLHVWPPEISLVLSPGAPSSHLSSQAFSTLPGFCACLLDEPISPELRGGRPLAWETWQGKVDGGICVACPGEAAGAQSYGGGDTAGTRTHARSHPTLALWPHQTM